MRHYSTMRPLCLCSAVCGFVALAASVGAQAATVEIQLTSVTTVVQQHDTKPKGKANKGDSIDFKDLLLNRVAQFGKANGKPVAYDVGHLVYRTATDRRITVVATFPGVGTISYTGDFTSDSVRTTVVQITGGTGGFKGAEGTVTIGPGEKAANIYRISLPHPIDINRTTGVA
jgi:hypothetical protein